MLKKGDKVRIVGIGGIDRYKDCVFEVLTEPYSLCGSIMVKIKCHETGKYFGGGYCVDFLEVMEDKQCHTKH